MVKSQTFVSRSIMTCAALVAMLSLGCNSTKSQLLGKWFVSLTNDRLERWEFFSDGTCAVQSGRVRSCTYAVLDDGRVKVEIEGTILTARFEAGKLKMEMVGNPNYHSALQRETPAALAALEVARQQAEAARQQAEAARQQAAEQARANRIVVGSKNFTEQVILGEMLAQQIERKTNLPVDRKLNLGGTLECHGALAAGQIDAYVEYTGTGLTAILKENSSSDPNRVYQTVKAEYKSRFGVNWTEPLGFNNTFAIIVRKSDAKQFNLKTISDAAPHTGNWVAGFGYEFRDRQDGYPGLAKTYNLRFPRPPLVSDLDLTYRAAAARQVDFVVGSSTDGRIEALGLVVLKDDKHYFPPYDAVPLVRDAVVKKHPEVREALRALGERLSDERMRRMNYAVDGQHRGVKDVVREFLDSL